MLVLGHVYKILCTNLMCCFNFVFSGTATVSIRLHLILYYLNCKYKYKSLFKTVHFSFNIYLNQWLKVVLLFEWIRSTLVSSQIGLFLSHLCIELRFGFQYFIATSSEVSSFYRI